MLKYFLCLTLVFFSAATLAKDEAHFFDINTAMQNEEAQQRLADGHINYYFGEQPHGEIVDRFVVVDATRKTNGFNKSDQEACDWAFLSVMIALREKALEYGANAIVNIHSYDKKRTYISEEKYECRVGTFAVSVTLKGSMVKVAE